LTTTFVLLEKTTVAGFNALHIFTSSVSSVVNELGREARGSVVTPPSDHRWDGRSVVSGANNGSVGGAGRDRTGDPLVANQVLSQLSYSPEEWWA
jgi:hypothetical protein